MKKIHLGLITFFLLVVGTTQPQQEVETYVSVLNPWTEPVEVSYVTFMDGKKILKITSGLADKIVYKPSIPEILAEHGYEIKDVQIWVHNHLSTSDFSQNDLTMYWYLRANGFNGVYMLKNDRGLFYLAPPQEEK